MGTNLFCPAFYLPEILDASKAGDASPLIDACKKMIDDNDCFCATLIINPAKVRKMPNYRDYVFVLWGELFDAVAAAIFVTELRNVGLRVKVVGVGGRHLKGANGLALMPDMTLEMALHLASKTIGVIVPASVGGCRRLNNDPRVKRFFEQVGGNQAQVIVGPPVTKELLALQQIPGLNDSVVVYPETEQLVGFARRVGKLLLNGDEG